MSLPDTDATPRSDIAACRDLLRGGSRTFYAASFLLPRQFREPATALYAFCRLADDALDVGDGGAPALANLRDRLGRAYDGRPFPVPADRAFAAVVRDFGIPRELPEALLEGLAWDAEGRRYDKLGDLHAYAARVAGAVGAMMAVVMGVRDAGAMARACDLGMAMQLTNIARDVGEDARAGRVYLPLQWLADAGIDADAWLRDPVMSPALARIIARLLSSADTLYARSETGLRQLPLSCRPGIRVAKALYSQIGREVEANGFDSVSSRARVPASRKARLAVIAVTSLDHAASAADVRTEPEAHFLVAAAQRSVARTSPPVLACRADRTFGSRVVWLIDLFERLARQEQMSRSRP